MLIRKRKYKSGRVAHQLDLGEIKGRGRVQLSFKTRAEAERARDKEAALRAEHGAQATEISRDEMAALLVARTRIVEAGGTVLEAVNFWLKHAARMKEEVKLPELVERFREVKRKGRRSGRYVAQLGVSLGSLASYLPMVDAHDVTRENLEAWIGRNGWGPKTKNNYLGDASAMFEWGLSAGLVRLNPAANIDRQRLDEGEIETLSYDECAALLNGARSDLRVLGYVVLGLFGGLRPAELGRIAWEAVDLTEGHAVVAGAHAKARRRRVVDLSDNARAWLALLPEVMRAGKICGKGFDDAWRMLRRELGWDVGRGASHLAKGGGAPLTRGKWKHNALRHTFASMHYAAHENEARLQVQMGHESATMLHRHYRALKTKGEAARFWALYPPV